jgi:hypothetical protein
MSSKGPAKKRATAKQPTITGKVRLMRSLAAAELLLLAVVAQPSSRP